MIIAKTKFLEFKSAKSPNNHDWSYVNRTNDSKTHDSAVCITTLVKQNNEYNFLFIKTKRPPIYAENKAQYCIESPAGLIGDENKCETLEECIRKELLEETGLVAVKIFIELNNSCTSAGLTSETLTYATAIIEDDNIVEKPVSDGGILVERFLVPAKEIYSYIKKLDTKEYSLASATICGIFFTLNRINETN